MMCAIYGSEVFSQAANLSVDLLNLEPPLDNPGYAPGVKAKKLTVQLLY